MQTTKRNIGARWHKSFLLPAIWIALGACSDDAKDSGDGGDMCMAADRALDKLIEQNASCTQDADCALVGDCNGHTDFRAIRTESAAQARDLVAKSCITGYDGPFYAAVCVNHQCGTTPMGTCMGHPDAGRDAGDLDASHDASSDASSDASTTSDASSLMDAHAQ